MPRAERNEKRKTEEAKSIPSKCSKITYFFNTDQTLQDEISKVPIRPKVNTTSTFSDHDINTDITVVPEISKESHKEKMDKNDKEPKIDYSTSSVSSLYYHGIS